MTARAFLAAAILLCLCAAPSHAKVIKDRKLGFTLEVPDGFKEFTESKLEPHIIHLYAPEEPRETDPILFFAIQRMGDRISSESVKDDFLRFKDDPRNHPAVTMLPVGVQVEMDLVRERWKGLGIDVYRARYTEDDVTLIMYGAPIPLRREAIQVIVCSQEINEDKGRALLRTLLANLEGESSWLPDGRELGSRRWSAERRDHFMKGLGSVLFWIAVIVIALHYNRKRKRKRARQAKQAADSPPPPPVAPRWPGPDEQPRPPSPD